MRNLYTKHLLKARHHLTTFSFSFSFSFLFLVPLSLHSQVAKTQVVRVTATANTNGTITLNWPAETYTGNFDIYRRSSQAVEEWGAAPVTTLAGNVSTYTDNTAKSGDAWEYLVVKRLASATDALGYIYAGNKAELQNQLQGIIVVVDSNYVLPLATEIARLKADLEAEGYFVNMVTGGRSEPAPAIRQRIVNAWNNARIKPSALYILGHVTVPYSGYFSTNGSAPPPDGHVEGSGNHTGAWPADVYYGTLSDIYTDTWVNCTTGASPRNYNIPGDGKFDQTKLPGNVNLEVGRVDLFNLPAFGKSDTVLVRNYLNRNHAWRTGQWKATERALIDNNFTSLNLASTGYANFAALIGNDSVFDNRDYFTSQKRGSYLWSYGCGAGSYTSCSGVGNTPNFNNDSFQNVFTILAGSYFGDWDVQNSFLRAPLAISSLASGWGGIPKWYLHHMGLGDRIGKGAKISTNNSTFYYSGNFNMSANSVHIALMGDPTLRMRNLPSLQTMNAVSANKEVTLWWKAVSEPGVGYFVYVTDTASNKLIRVSDQIITDTFFVDKHNYFTGTYDYTVRPVRIETTASGTYYNTGGGITLKVNHVNGLQSDQPEVLQTLVFPNPVGSGDEVHVQLQNANARTAEIKIYTTDGKLVASKMVDVDASTQTANISSDQLEAGLYLITIRCGEQTGYSRLLVR